MCRDIGVWSNWASLSSGTTCWTRWGRSRACTGSSWSSCKLLCKPASATSGGWRYRRHPPEEQSHRTNNLTISPYQVLMQQSSPGSIQSEIDEAALKDLLQLVPNRPRLTGLKLCLADLRRDVKELNLQLGDRYWKYSSHYFTLFILLGLGVPPQLDL